MPSSSELLTQFLDSLKTNQGVWKRGIELFVEFTDNDVKTILYERKDDLTPREGENFIFS
jgi:hypothetical protein